MANLAIRALYETGERGIVFSGYADLSAASFDATAPDYDAVQAYATEHIYFGNDLNHEWLFPQCKCTVHHGGSGTTHCALRVKVGGGAAAALPRDCLCPSGAAAAIAPARGQFSPQFSRDHGLPAHSVAALPPPLLPLVDALTRDDARLFVAGLARLLRELAAVERAVRGRLVCDAKLHALRAELAYLPGAAAALDEFEAIR